jgi:hypothetical protein
VVKQIRGVIVSIKECLQQIHDEADHIVNSGRFFDPPTSEEKIVIADAKSIKRLAKEAIKELNDKKEKKSFVKKWICSGKLDPSNNTIEDVLVNCARCLDKNCAHDILGDVVFLGDNGKYYSITVEAVIHEADMDYVKDLISEDSHNQ